MVNPGAKDEAGPLWLLLESVLESLPFWARMALAAGFVLAVLGLIALLIAVVTRRKS